MIINPVDLKVGIKLNKKVSKGGVLMEVTSKEDCERLKLEIQKNEQLKYKYTIRKSEKLRPKIVIYGIDDKLENEEIIHSLQSQNVILSDAQIKTEFHMKT